MALIATLLIALVMLIHVYIVLIETVLFRSRGVKVFGLNQEKADIMATGMFNQGCYNAFLVAALALGLCLPAPYAQAFAIFGLVCVGVAGVVGGITVGKRIFFVQTVPAAAALLAIAAL